MRFLRQLLSNMKEAFQGIVRNKGMGVLSVISISAVLVLFGVVLLLIVNMSGVINEAAGKADSVVVYLLEGATDEQMQGIIDKAESTGYVEDVTFTSKDQALEEFQEQLNMSGNEYLIEGLDKNPLPSSITLKLSSLDKAETVANQVQGMPGVEKASYLDDLVEKIIQMTEWVQILGIIVVAILLVIAIVLIHNTIKATLSNREEQIHIMKYIGASNGYIRRPLLMEGMIFGVIASIIALVIVYFGYDYIFSAVEERLRVSFGMQLIPAKSILFDLGVIFASIGVGVGLLGSSLSIKRFLNV